MIFQASDSQNKACTVIVTPEKIDFKSKSEKETKTDGVL